MKKKKSLICILCMCIVSLFFTLPVCGQSPEGYSVEINARTNATYSQTMPVIVSGDISVASRMPFTLGPYTQPFTVTLEPEIAKVIQEFGYWEVDGIEYSPGEKRITVMPTADSPVIVVVCHYTIDTAATPEPGPTAGSTASPGPGRYLLSLGDGSLSPEDAVKVPGVINVSGDYTGTFKLPTILGPHEEPFTVTIHLKVPGGVGIQFVGWYDYSTGTVSSGQEITVGVDDVTPYRQLFPQYVVWSTPSPVPTDVTPEPTAGDTTPDPGTRLGDVNGNGSIDIIDALLVAQYYVGLNPSNFDMDRADVTRDGLVNIVDGLRIAQCYVGLISCNF
jgi:hypothetical protein